VTVRGWFTTSGSWGESTSSSSGHSEGIIQVTVPGRPSPRRSWNLVASLTQRTSSDARELSRKRRVAKNGVRDNTERIEMVSAVRGALPSTRGESPKPTSTRG